MNRRSGSLISFTCSPDKNQTSTVIFHSQFHTSLEKLPKWWVSNLIRVVGCVITDRNQGWFNFYIFKLTLTIVIHNTSVWEQCLYHFASTLQFLPQEQLNANPFDLLLPSEWDVDYNNTPYYLTFCIFSQGAHHSSLAFIIQYTLLRDEVKKLMSQSTNIYMFREMIDRW